MGTLVEAVKYIQTQTITLTGVREAPDYPPGTLGSTPIFICVPSGGQYESLNRVTLKNRHEIALQLWVSRKDLPRDVEKLAPFIDTVSNMLWGDPTLGGNVMTIVSPITYSVGARDYGAQTYLVCEWIITVKQENTIT